MFDASICGCVLLIANILCLFSGWTSWYEHIFCCVVFVHHIVLFGVNPINKTSRMIFCCTSYCLLGSYTLFGWIPTSVWLEVLLLRSSFVGTRIMSKKSNTVRNLRIGVSRRVPVRPEWVGFGGEIWWRQKHPVIYCTFWGERCFR